MRWVLLFVTIVAGCASSTHEQRVARMGPLHQEPPLGSIEKDRTGESRERPPGAMPRTTRDEPIGPLRDIPPVPPIP
jgi:hypothetical protein